MSLDERKAVRDFVVGHPLYGKVQFKGPIDMTKLAELHCGKVSKRKEGMRLSVWPLC